MGARISAGALFACEGGIGNYALKAFAAAVEDPRSMTFLGCVHEGGVMNAYNRAPLNSRREEHE